MKKLLLSLFLCLISVITFSQGQAEDMNSKLVQICKNMPGNELFKQIRIFRTETEYYIPLKEEVSLIPEFQFRPTVLWKDDVYIDGSGPVKFKYPDNMGKGTAMIFVNGVSFTNLVGSETSGCKVK